MGFLLTNQLEQTTTQVPNAFIDEYMPNAHGSFVKVYLFLLRHALSSPALTIETMADMLSNTEADILRALRYWNKQGLLSLTETDGQITSVTLLSLASQDDTPATTVLAPESVTTMAPGPEALATTAPGPEAPATTAPTQETAAAKEADLPPQHSYSPLQAEALKKDTEIDSCLSIVEALLGTTLGDAHMQLILYLMSDLGFSRELVTTLYETALSRGTSKIRYIEAVALDWAKKGIRTSEEAEKEAAMFNGLYRTVTNALGLRRALAPAEMKIVDHWEDYHFTAEIIKEACDRTVLQSGDINLRYTWKILKDWHEKGVTTLKDVEECDQSYFRQKSATGKKANSSAAAKNKFQNFPQRDYSQSEYDDLEKKLLNP